MVFKKSSGSEISGEKKSKKSKRFGKKSKFGVLFLLILVVLLALGGAFYMYIYKNDSISKDVLSETNLDTEQVQFLLDEVSKLIELPKDETPDIATVTDVAKLSNQEFFKNAQNGDKVLIYRSTKKAILYRPSTGKIIDVAPVNLTADSDGSVLSASNETENASPSAESLTPVPAQKFKVVVMNSTLESGLAKKGSDLLDEDVVEVVRTLNSSGDYTTTSISKVDGSSAKITDAQLKEIISVFEEIKPQITKVPEDETVPSGADILIILGEDFSDAY